MIIISPDVIRDGSNVPHIEGAIVSPILEVMTGADCLISKLDIPAGKPALIKEHIANRALLVQIKVGADYPSSFGNRLHMSQAKMKEASASPQQRWLVTVGVYTKSNDGELLVNGVVASKLIPGQRYTFKAAVTARRSWQLRGGCYENCYNGERLIDWLKETEEWLQSKQPEIVYGMPEIDMPEIDDNDEFQIAQRAPKGVVGLAQFVGPQHAIDAWKASGSVKMAFDWVFGPQWRRDKSPVKGIGKGIIGTAHDRMGMESGEIFDLTTELNGNGDY